MSQIFEMGLSFDSIACRNYLFAKKIGNHKSNQICIITLKLVPESKV